MKENAFYNIHSQSSAVKYTVQLVLSRILSYFNQLLPLLSGLYFYFALLLPCVKPFNTVYQNNQQQIDYRNDLFPAMENELIEIEHSDYNNKCKLQEGINWLIHSLQSFMPRQEVRQFLCLDKLLELLFEGFKRFTVLICDFKFVEVL